MKKTLLMGLACVAMLAALSVSAFAAGPDTTPPVVWGFGMSATAVKTVGCDGNVSIMVQTKASDLNGIRKVYLQGKRTGDLEWDRMPMRLRPDGYWRAYIPKSAFTREAVGTWMIRVVAYDTFNNVTKSGSKYIEVSTCAFDHDK